jgi:hypothetical protein
MMSGAKPGFMSGGIRRMAISRVARNQQFPSGCSDGQSAKGPKALYEI